MNPRDPFPQFDRRSFFRHGTASALALTTAGALAKTKVHAAAREPFAYDISKYRNVDPALVKYERVARFHCPRPDARRLVIGSDGKVYLATAAGVCVLAKDGSLLNDIPSAVPARGVAIADDGSLFLALRDHVEHFDAKGRPLASWDTPKGRPFLTGIAVGPKDIFVADSGNRVVHRYDRDGKLVGRIGERDPARNVPGLVLPSPFLDVEIAPDGLLRVNNPGRHRVEVYTPEGHLELFWGRPSIAIDGFCGCCNPVGLAMLPDGRHVTFEKGLPRVKVYTAEGKFESVVAAPDFFQDIATSESMMSADQTSYGGLDGTVDAEGNIFILELLGGEIHVMKEKV
jgi:sugar lactone lactonase YvrE